MSDLISRSEVNNVIDKLEVYTCGRPNTTKVEIAVLQLQRFINKLKNIPNAYSFDKVVKELEELKMRYFLTIANTGDEKSDFAYENVGNALDKAMEIVKHGCASDDVCEWKYINDFELVSENHESKCIEGYDYKYCPYCGKRIKVVE